MEASTSIASAVNLFCFFSSVTANRYLKASLVSTVAREAPMKKSPFIK